MSYTPKGKLSVENELVKFIENELLPDTNISPERFWKGLDKATHELAPKNKKLLDMNVRTEIMDVIFKSVDEE